MKRFYTYLFLIFFTLQAPSLADDIRDFEIEGMSLGDSLLDYMKKSLIKSEINNKKITFYYEDKYVSISAWEIRNKFKTYSDVGIVFNPNDNKYEILSLEGTLTFDNIDQCHKKQKEIAKEIKKSLDLQIKEEIWFVEKERIAKDLFSVKNIDFNFSKDLNKGSIVIVCYDIKDKNKKDLLYVTINSAEFDLYLVDRAKN